MSNGHEGNEGSRYAVTVRRAANLPTAGWADERIAAVARTVAPEGASPAEIGMFLAVAHRYDLDPFLKEIWLIKDRGRLMVLVGRDSFLKVARRDENYRGYRAGAVYEKDEFSVHYGEEGVQATHNVNGFERGGLMGAYCIVYQAHRPAVLILRKFGDYRHLHAKDNWKQNPEDMLLARVITSAHRLAFNISGLYTPDEMVDVDFQEGVDTDSARAAGGTRATLEDLKTKLRKPVEAEEVQAAEVVEEVAAPIAGPEFGIELPDWDKDSSIPANPPANGNGVKSSYERAKGAYFARWGELGLSDDIRKAWQEEYLGKASASHFSEDDYRKALDLLAAGVRPAAPEVGTDEAQTSALPF